MVKDNLTIDNDILELEGVSEFRNDNCNYYTYNDTPVPRVSHILQQCRDSNWLIQWAANIGRRKYDYYTEKALTVGTIAHEIIDEYLKIKYNAPTQGFTYMNKNFHVNYDLIEFEYRDQVFNVVENFKNWEKGLSAYNTYIDEVIAIELPVVCPWYGGTVDAILRINGAVYLCDFKTSKSINPEYLLQVSAYKWIIDNGYISGIPHIDGVGILRMEKSRITSVDDLFINDFDIHGHNMIVNYTQCFFAYLEAYYRTININYITKQYHPNPDFYFGKGEINEKAS